MLKLFNLLIPLFMFSSFLKSEVIIQSYHKQEWKTEWTKSFLEEFSKDTYKSMLDRTLDSNDLKNLACPNYNKMSTDEKKDFWLVFFSALARSESGLNEKAKSRVMRGHRSYGLLQLAPETALKFCDLILLDEEILDGEDNLVCGLKLMNWQLSGAPDHNGIMKRPDLENQIFGKHILLWGPLRQNDKAGRKRLYDWFKIHLNQLPFCNALEAPIMVKPISIKTDPPT